MGAEVGARVAGRLGVERATCPGRTGSPGVQELQAWGAHGLLLTGTGHQQGDAAGSGQRAGSVLLVGPQAGPRLALSLAAGRWPVPRLTQGGPACPWGSRSCLALDFHEC